MANTKKTTSAPAKNSGKATPPAAPERDPYAYYDDLYEKKPRKKKKTDEKLPEEDYEKYNELFERSKTEPKKRKKDDAIPIDDEILDLTPPSSKTLHRLMPYILGVVTIFIIACFLLARIDGAMGDLGLLLRNAFFGFFGWPAYFIPIVLVNMIIYWRRYVDLAIIRRKIIFGISIPLLLSSLIHSLAIAILYDGYKWADWGKSILGLKGATSNWRLGVELHGGGFFGGLFGGFFRCLVGYVGSVIVIIAILALSIIFYVGLTPRHFLDMLASAVNKIKEKRAERKAAVQVEEDDEDEEEIVEEKPKTTRSKRKPKPEPDDISDVGDAIPSPDDEIDEKTDEPALELKPAGGTYDPDAVEIVGSIEITPAETDKKTKTVDSLRRVAETESIEELGDIVDTVFKGKKSPEVELVPAPTPAPVTPALELTEAEVITPAPDEAIDDEPEEDAIVLPENAKKKQEYEQLAAYIFPPLTLLRESTSPGRDEINAELRANAETLLEKLESFNVKLSKIEYSRGPTLTRYELYPAPGVKANSIKNLQLDIAMALQAKIRIEAPIPGKSAVGVEVPNKLASTVAIRELLESDQFKNAKSKLYACLGKDITGEPIFIDIGKMPHLLIAGTTGSGKSVCINSIIISLLYKSRPDEVRFIMIDPKKVEMAMYNNLPHLRVPVVTNVKKAAGTLNAAVDEMERRYELFENNFARDIDGYNRMMKAQDPDFIPLHRLVIVIDELADLMMSAPTEIETSIVRLAQKARAAGIHLIIGTQRPSVDVITGLIKANIPSRIAFAVASGIDSRTIIDTVGAEKLLGRGDMLFCPIGSQTPTRAQGTFVTDEEVVAVTNFLKENSTGAHYDEEFVSQIEKASEQIVTVTPGQKKPTGGNAGGAASGSSEAFDELFFDALQLAVESGTVATSFLQRNINVGFGRGARIIDRMAKLGFVTPPDGTKPRQVLLTQSQLAELIARDDKRIYGLIPQDEEEE